MKPSTRIAENLLFLVDDGGHGRDCHLLTTFDAAKQQLDRWRGTYPFDYDEALILLVEFFKNEPAGEELTGKLLLIVKHLLKIPTLACRNAKDLDFHILHVTRIELILRAAYQLGRVSMR